MHIRQQAYHPRLVGTRRISHRQSHIGPLVGEMSEVNRSFRMQQGGIREKDAPCVSEFNTPPSVAAEESKSMFLFNFADLFAESRVG